MRKVRADKLSSTIRRPLRLPATEELPVANRDRLCRVRRALPQLDAENPHSLRSLLAIPGPAPQASEERRNEILRLLREKPIFPRNDLWQVGLISEDVKMWASIGQLWRAVEASTGGGSYEGKTRPISPRGRGRERMSASRTCGSRLSFRM